MLNYKKVVIKVGTNVITNSKGYLSSKSIKRIVSQILKLRAMGVEVVLVSSGAVGAGKSLVHNANNIEDKLIRKQVLASVGQIKIINTYEKSFNKEYFVCSQVLVTKEDFRDRDHFVNIKNVMEASLKCGVIPIVNENDSISIRGITFTDNDELAGLVASMIDAEAVIIMTSVDGLYTGDPSDPKNKLIKFIEPRGEDLSGYISSTKSSLGRGGMATKCKVASRMSQVGIACHFINGKKQDNLINLMEGQKIGTVFLPDQKKPFKQKWICHSSGFEKGVIYVDPGIEELLKSPEKKVSILPVGVYKVEGEFVKGDVVKICNQKRQTIGYGITQVDSEEVFEKLKQNGEKPIIRYDNLFMEK